jgi:hypothetical protein
MAKPTDKQILERPSALEATALAAHERIAIVQRHRRNPYHH